MNFPYYTNIQSSQDVNKQWMQNQQPNMVQSQQSAPSNGGGFGQTAGNVMAGLSAAQANSEPADSFSIDPYAGFKGSAQGLSGGGVVGAIIGGVGAQVGQFSKINKNLKNLDTSVQGISYDAYGRPVFQGQEVVGAMEKQKALQEGMDSMKGTKAWIDPANQAFAWAFGTKKKIKRKMKELRDATGRAQQTYNESEQKFQQQQNQMEDYYQRLNNDRMMNLYRAKMI